VVVDLTAGAANRDGHRAANGQEGLSQLIDGHVPEASTCDACQVLFTESSLSRSLGHGPSVVMDDGAQAADESGFELVNFPIGKTQVTEESLRRVTSGIMIILLVDENPGVEPERRFIPKGALRF